MQRIDLTKQQIGAVMTALGDAWGDDERLLLDSLEAETDLFEIVRKLLDAIEDDEGKVAALTEQMAARKERRDRGERRITAAREAITALMECAGIDKLPMPEATLSLREVPAKLAVNDPAAVPEEYTVSTPKPSMDAIKAAFTPKAPGLPNWLQVVPARQSLTIRKR